MKENLIATLKSMCKANPNCTLCYGTGETRKVVGKQKRIIIPCPHCFPRPRDAFPGGPILHDAVNRKHRVWTGGRR